MALYLTNFCSSPRSFHRKTPEICVGGLTLDNNNRSLCADGNYGPFCAVCKPDYAPSEGKCAKCTGDAQTTVVMGVFALIVGITVAVVGCWKLKSTDEEITIEKQEVFLKKMQKKIAKAKAAITKVKIQGKIVLSYFQIAIGLSFNFNLHFPVSFTNIMNSIQIMNFDFGSYMPINCMIEMNYLSSLYGMTLGSLALMFSLYTGSKALAAKSKSGVSPAYGSDVTKTLSPRADLKKGKTDWSTLLFNNLLPFTFLILPSISTKIIYTFACLPLSNDDGTIDYEDSAALPINLNEGTFLKADYSIRCDSDERKTAMGHAAVMLLIFPIGIPTWYYYQLWKERDHLDPGQGAPSQLHEREDEGQGWRCILPVAGERPRSRDAAQGEREDQGLQANSQGNFTQYGGREEGRHHHPRRR